MNNHPYWRAYMAGIAAPTMFLLVVMTGFTVLRYVYDFPAPVERVIVFPMAMVPNLWGLWNVLYLRMRSGRHLPLGAHGAILPFLLAPAGLLMARLIHVEGLLHSEFILFGFPMGLLAYYLVWKHLVGFFNRTLGIA